MRELNHSHGKTLNFELQVTDGSRMCFFKPCEVGSMSLTFLVFMCFGK